MIKRTSRYPTGTALSPPGRGKQIWVRPYIPGSSRGSGATEDFLLSDLLTGYPQHLTLGPETKSSHIDEDGEIIDGVAKQVLYCSTERPPQLTPDIRHNVSRQDYEWVILLGERTDCTVEVYTDGSLRYPGTALDSSFPQPKYHRRASYVQGGILFSFDLTEPIDRRRNDISVITTKGLELGLCSPASIELYTILQAIHSMEIAHLNGVIHTDYKKIVNVSNNSALLIKMGREANLPIIETILLLLSKNPMITLRHVKAHGKKTKLKEWTREQWGNMYADAIAKNQVTSFSRQHIELSLHYMEQLVMSQDIWY